MTYCTYSYSSLALTPVPPRRRRPITQADGAGGQEKKRSARIPPPPPTLRSCSPPTVGEPLLAALALRGDQSCIRPRKGFSPRGSARTCEHCIVSSHCFVLHGFHGRQARPLDTAIVGTSSGRSWMRHPSWDLWTRPMAPPPTASSSVGSTAIGQAWRSSAPSTLEFDIGASLFASCCWDALRTSFGKQTRRDTSKSRSTTLSF
jgi:hypothetical protein